MLGHVKTLSLVLAVNIIAGGTFAFGQSVIADRTSSYAANLAPGYDVTGIVFDLDNADPNFVDVITFKVTPRRGAAQAKQVEIQTEADGKWTKCSLANDTPPTRMVTCRFASLAAEDITALDIIVK